MGVKCFRVSVDGDAVRVLRTKYRIEALDAFVVEFAELNDLLAEVWAERGELRVLVDLREAVGRNDAEFEAAVAPHRKRLFLGNKTIAVLVQTQVGAMQIRRHLAMDGAEVPVFDDEGAANRWLHPQ